MCEGGCGNKDKRNGQTTNAHGESEGEIDSEDDQASSDEEDFK